MASCTGCCPYIFKAAKNTCGAGPVIIGARVGNNGPNGECIDLSNPTIRIYVVRRHQMMAELPAKLL